MHEKPWLVLQFFVKMKRNSFESLWTVTVEKKVLSISRDCLGLLKAKRKIHPSCICLSSHLIHFVGMLGCHFPNLFFTSGSMYAMLSRNQSPWMVHALKCLWVDTCATLWCRYIICKRGSNSVRSMEKNTIKSVEHQRRGGTDKKVKMMDRPDSHTSVTNVLVFPSFNKSSCHHQNQFWKSIFCKFGLDGKNWVL